MLIKISKFYKARLKKKYNLKPIFGLNKIYISHLFAVNIPLLKQQRKY